MAGAEAPLARRSAARAPLLLAALALVFTAARSSEAAAPRAEWRTISTPRFRVHYHEGLGPLAARLAPAAEAALDELEQLLESAPRTPIHVVLTDETDAANGFANVVPENAVTLYTGVPEAASTLGDYDDFMRLLLVHELTHVVHLDTIGGIPSLLNAVLGKTFVPNQVQPRWFIEGIAVYVESKVSSGGRVRSAVVDLLLRAQVLAGRMFTLDEITTDTRRFPGGTVAWDFGGRFVDFIARRHGPAALAAISREYGGRLVPYALNVVARHATGEDYVELWDAWLAEEEVKARALVAKLAASGGIRAGALFPRPAEEVLHPRFGRDGSLAFVEAPRDGDPELVVLAPDLRTERLRLRTSRGVGAFTPDGARYVASVFDLVDGAYTYGDLELIDLATGERRRRTIGERLDEPDVSPDGRTIVAVQQSGGRAWLAVLPLDGDAPPRALPFTREGEEPATPRWSPDGRRLVAAVHVPSGGRHLVLFDVATGARRTLTRTRAHDLHPVWSPDGRRVLFTSDRSGVLDVWAVDVETGALAKLSQVTTGALEPAIDPAGERLLFVHGTADGWELRELPAAGLHPPLERPREAAPLRPPPRALTEAHTVTRTATATATRTATSSAKGTATSTATSTETGAAALEDAPYDPWETLLPKAWLPITGVDGLGDTVGISVTGDDVVGRHGYRADLEYGLESKRLNWALQYVNRTLTTPISLSGSAVATSRPASFAGATAADDRPESVLRARVGIDLPFGRWDGGFGLGLSYGLELREALQALSRDPAVSPPPAGAADLHLASFGLSFRFSSVRGSADAFSPERGIALDAGLQVYDPRIGADLRLILATTHGTAYVPLPWAPHHVLALRLALSGSSGDARGRSVYTLGGLPVRNILRDAIDDVRAGGDALRGFPVGALRGGAYWLASAEYRFPVLRVERGLWTLPFYVDRAYAAVFADVGDAPPDRLDLARAKGGVGAELRLDLVAGYYRPATLRFGYARGLGELGIDNVYLMLGYGF